MDTVFLRKHYCREVLEQIFRDNVTYPDVGKMVKEPGQEIHGSLPMVYIIGGTDFPLAGEVNCKYQ